MHGLRSSTFIGLVLRAPQSSGHRRCGRLRLVTGRATTCTTTFASSGPRTEGRRSHATSDIKISVVERPRLRPAPTAVDQEAQEVLILQCLSVSVGHLLVATAVGRLSQVDRGRIRHSDKQTARQPSICGRDTSLWNVSGKRATAQRESPD